MTMPWLFYSQACLQHLTAGHPESPERLRAILKQLDLSGLLAHLPQFEPSPIDTALLRRIHQPAYIASFERFCQQAGQGTRIDEDTVVSEGSYAAAQHAAGAAIHLTEALISERCNSAFALIRPPGHHAMPQHLMGFCFFNNVALAALYALEQLGLQRVAILDWDAHHGNGTEHIFYRDPRVLTVSWHQDPNWPGTGHVSDLGEGPGLGYNLNIPLPAGSTYPVFAQTYTQVVQPALARFQPQLLLVSAGYDAHHADSLTDMGLSASGFARLTELIMQGAESLGVEKVGFLLEGGYNLEALAHSVTATLRTLSHQEAQHEAEPFSAPPEHDSSSVSTLIEQLQNMHPLLNKGASI